MQAVVAATVLMAAAELTELAAAAVTPEATADPVPAVPAVVAAVTALQTTAEAEMVQPLELAGLAQLVFASLPITPMSTHKGD